MISAEYLRRGTRNEGRICIPRAREKRNCVLATRVIFRSRAEWRTEKETENRRKKKMCITRPHKGARGAKTSTRGIKGFNRARERGPFLAERAYRRKLRASKRSHFMRSQSWLRCGLPQANLRASAAYFCNYSEFLAAG